MSLSLNQKSKTEYTPQNPGTVTHKWLKELYFKSQEKNVEIILTDQTKNKIREYLQTTINYKDKRNWDGADQMHRNNLQFAKKLGINLTKIKQ